MLESAESSEDETGEKMTAIQPPSFQVRPFNNPPLSSGWMESTRGSSSLRPQLDLRVAPQKLSVYSCFQLSPIATQAPALRFLPLSSMNPAQDPNVTRAEGPRLPRVVERALAPRKKQYRMEPIPHSRKPDRTGSSMIMSRFMSEYQDTRESRAIRRRQERSPPPTVSAVPVDLVNRAHTTRKVVGAEFLRSLGKAGRFSPEVEMAIRLALQADDHELPYVTQSALGQRSYTFPSVQYTPPTRSGIGLESSFDRGRASPSQSSWSNRHGDADRSSTTKLTRALRESHQINSHHRATSVPAMYGGHDDIASPPFLAIAAQKSPRMIKRHRSRNGRTSHASSAHGQLSPNSGRGIRFTEVRSLQDGDRPSDSDRILGLSLLSQAALEQHGRALQVHRIAEPEDDVRSQKGWDGSQCSDSDRVSLQSPKLMITRILSNIDLVEESPRDTSQQQILLSLLPQPLSLRKVESPPAQSPKLRFDALREDRALSRDSKVCEEEPRRVFDPAIMLPKEAQCFHAASGTYVEAFSRYF